MSQAIAPNGHAPQPSPLPGKASGDDNQPMPKFMKRIEVYVPTTLNNGKPVSVKELRAIQQRVMNVFGGYTFHPNLHGGWLDEDRHPFRDAIRKIEIEVVDSPQSVMEVVALASFIRQHLGQKAIFVTLQDVGVLSI